MQLYKHSCRTHSSLEVEILSFDQYYFFAEVKNYIYRFTSALSFSVYVLNFHLICLFFLEPGYYEDGAFGIRIENVVLVVPAKTKVGPFTRPKSHGKSKTQL